MKSLLTLVLLIGGLTSFAKASTADNKCSSLAESAVKHHVRHGYYDKNGIETISCATAPNGGAIICGVGASKGDGAASDTYQVVLSSDCQKVYRVELKGEE